MTILALRGRFADCERERERLRDLLLDRLRESLRRPPSWEGVREGVRVRLRSRAPFMEAVRERGASSEAAVAGRLGVGERPRETLRRSPEDDMV